MGIQWGLISLPCYHHWFLGTSTRTAVEPVRERLNFCFTKSKLRHLVCVRAFEEFGGWSAALRCTCQRLGAAACYVLHSIARYSRWHWRDRTKRSIDVSLKGEKQELRDTADKTAIFHTNIKPTFQNKELYISLYLRMKSFNSSSLASSMI